ncbi:hypothetical protein NPIL_690501 [Nephila pilipes]|uniref:Uncharacterized protein n=1 Tax=Nephila pilipes TaxID=299642 RepID=A0A8X6N7D0_NEPPI|nr:hypothetical protein NPIL_690501 [Nephila pilipes]
MAVRMISCTQKLSLLSYQKRIATIPSDNSSSTEDESCTMKENLAIRKEFKPLFSTTSGVVGLKEHYPIYLFKVASSSPLYAVATAGSNFLFKF